MMTPPSDLRVLTMSSVLSFSVNDVKYFKRPPAPDNLFIKNYHGARLAVIYVPLKNQTEVERCVTRLLPSVKKFDAKILNGCDCMNGNVFR